MGLHATGAAALTQQTSAAEDVLPFGEAVFAGSTGDLKLKSPVVAMAVTPPGTGYWQVASDGGIFAYGDATFHGSTGAMKLAKPIVGMASTPTGNGYWLVASDGGIFAFGDATFHGSTGAMKLAKPIVGMASTPTGNGYWLVASDGGIFAFGDATFHGSTGAKGASSPVTGIASTRTGEGYWLVTRDGAIFTFGDATFRGSLNGVRATNPIVGIAPTKSDEGYWLLALDGGVFSFGSAEFHGSSAPYKLSARGKFAAGIATTPAVNGYWVVMTRLVPNTISPKSKVLYDARDTGNFEIYTRDLATNAITRLTKDTRYDSWWAKASPNGREIVFYRTPAGVWDSDYGQTSLWKMNADGSRLRQIVANGQYDWKVQGHVDWSPDGTKLVMFGGVVYSGIVVTNTEGVPIHRVGNGIDPVWSTDGTRILYVNCSNALDYPNCPKSDYRVWSVNLDGSDARRLTNVPVAPTTQPCHPTANTSHGRPRSRPTFGTSGSPTPMAATPESCSATATSTPVPFGSPQTRSSFTRPRPRRTAGSASGRSAKMGLALRWVTTNQTNITEWPSGIR